MERWVVGFGHREEVVGDGFYGGILLSKAFSLPSGDRDKVRRTWCRCMLSTVKSAYGSL